ncbi:OB-fold nucleic acid binding domain-containing protein [Synechocystis sp. LEGE 06083]|uniref:OB-fold nucleic acid binding domain-containing protein n=1 Tax=Synechocystis sp. LEGE 06083 TaxID=915336 RepID=UPI0018815FFD|nr:OB-fold nucleic acid binding domain-containing protein [Synechocystis sp. LEGE 06083]MBE9195575.1 OB-fold nucleic acid binding domain-containing protein [Synechocystis sp. LEGE 06083]
MKLFQAKTKYNLYFFLAITFIIWICGKFYRLPFDEAETYTGQTFSLSQQGKLVLAEGTVKRAGKNRQGITFLTIQGEQGEFGASFFPSLGKLPFNPRVGDYISVLGLLGSYQGKPQISPLSSQAISLKDQSNYQTNNNFPLLLISELSDYIDQIVIVQNVRVISVEKFKSREGKQMLRFKLIDSNNRESIDGVFFEGDWDEEMYQLMNEEKTINILAKVTRFRGNLSLNAKNVELN